MCYMHAGLHSKHYWIYMPHVDIAFEEINDRARLKFARVLFTGAKSDRASMAMAKTE